MSDHIKKHKQNTETYIGISVLLILSGIAFGIYLTQFHFSPAVPPINFNPGGASGPESVQSLISLPENAAPLTRPEIFEAGSLSDKIDGKAELYLSAGFLRLHCQRFRRNDDPESWAEIFVYDMGNPRNAFSVFSSQTRKDAEPLDVTKFAYRTENAVFLAQGNYYLEIVSSVASEENFELMNSALKKFIRDNPIKAEASSLGETDLFPEPGQIENSMTLLSADVFGYRELNRVFTATYNIGGTELRAFVSRRETSEEAERLASGFHTFLMSFGAKEQPLTKQIGNAKLVEIMESYDIIFTRGLFLGGIHEAENKEAAEKLAESLYRQLPD